MRQCDPRHRYNALRERKQLPESDAERTIYVLIHTEAVFNKDLPLKPWPAKQVLDPVGHYAWDIYNNLALRNLFEAFLFASEDNELVYNSLGVDYDEIGFYRTLFFDTNVFRNDLERIAWMQTIPDSDSQKELFRIAFNQGLAALRWHYCRNKGEVSPEEAEKVVLTDSFVQYLGHRGKPLTGKVAKEARGLSKVILEAVKTMRTKEDTFDGASSEGIRFKFTQARDNKTLEDLQAEGVEVIH